MSVRRGTISFEAADKGYSIRLGTNQIVHIEEYFGKPFKEVAKGLDSEDGILMKDFRAFVAIAAGLPDDEAGDLIDELGHERVADLLGQAMQASFPAPEKGSSDKDAPGNGRRRKRT